MSTPAPLWTGVRRCAYRAPLRASPVRAHGKDRCLKGMVTLLRRLSAIVHWSRSALLAVAICLPPVSTALATQDVTVQFATADGKPMANAEVTVFAPGDLKTPVETGHADSVGKFVFEPDRDGLWTARARTESEVVQVTTRVGGPGQQQQRGWISPVVMTSGLLGLLVLAAWYRMLIIRNRRR